MSRKKYAKRSCKKAQSWSFDAILGVVIFIATAITLLAIINSGDGKKLEQAREDSERVLSLMKSEDSSISIVEGRQIDQSKLEALLQKEFSEIKSEAGVRSDFCIYFEDQDGNLIQINGSNGMGSDEINVSGTPCG